MPESYPSIGEAIGAAMKHNIRLAHGGEAPDSPAPLSVRFLPSPAADPYSVPGMIARLTETATPSEVAEILEEVNDTLVGALPQLTELVAAAADWTRVRLTFDDAGPNPTFEAWTRLAAATRTLREIQADLDVLTDTIADCPAVQSDPKHHAMVNPLRTRELLDDVFADEPVAASAPAATPPTGEADRQRAARATSPHASTRNVTPSTGPATAPSMPDPSARPLRTR
ncbi:hypothetical protein [Streptomyces acidiscabies]|uniref:Uncharacterized protein n=1 Tax=Streptomyces acidiscabies TaxID=42234 RepID=A0A0L0KL41_9ACTN|nr:hypothetical protein [Streptomyces acidiscabies]KND38325.1 hypothetical protein IQ63_08185 [Streptomyces acidiscabies]